MRIASVLDSSCSLISGRGRLPDIQRSSFFLSSSNNAMSRLPEEVISQIIETVYYDEDMNPDYQSLSSCSLLCKHWSAPSQKLLFRHVVLKSSSAFASFRSVIEPTTARAHTLMDDVVRLKVIIDHNHSNQISHRALAAAILSCPNLYELEIAVYGCQIPVAIEADADTSGIRMFRAAPSFDSDTLDLLRAGPAIQSLKFSNWSDNEQLAFQLLSGVWPSLSAVSLRGTPPRLPAFDKKPISPFGCTLRELRLGFQTTLQTGFVDWLMENSSRSLHTLELERVPETELLVSLLGRCGPSLVSLSLPSCTLREHVSLVHCCKRLKEFRFENANVSPLLLKGLPTTLDHLAFSISRDTPLYLIVNFIKSRRHLKAVTVHVWDDATSHDQIPGLRIACAYNNVELHILRGIQCFREVVRGDPVPCLSYPRFKEPTNLRRMLCDSRHKREDTAGNFARRARVRAELVAPMISHAIITAPEFAVTNEVSVIAGPAEKM